MDEVLVSPQFLRQITCLQKKKKKVETLSDVVNHELGRTESTGNFWKCENDESKISQEVTEKPFEF